MITMTYKQILLTGGLSLLLITTITYLTTRVPKVTYVKMDIHVGEDK